jgi:hypothetical protein
MNKNNVCYNQIFIFSHMEHWDNELWFFNCYLDGFLPILFYLLILIPWIVGIGSFST